MFGVRFFMSCAVVGVKRGKKGGREGGTEIPFTACPVEMAAVIPLTETVLC